MKPNTVINRLTEAIAAAERAVMALPIDTKPEIVGPVIGIVSAARIAIWELQEYQTAEYVDRALLLDRATGWATRHADHDGPFDKGWEAGLTRASDELRDLLGDHG